MDAGGNRLLAGAALGRRRLIWQALGTPQKGVVLYRTRRP